MILAIMEVVATRPIERPLLIGGYKSAIVVFAAACMTPIPRPLIARKIMSWVMDWAKPHNALAMMNQIIPPIKNRFLPYTSESLPPIGRATVDAIKYAVTTAE